MKTRLLSLLCGVLTVAAEAGLDNPVVESLEVQENYARGGDPLAQYNLGLAYYRGEGVAKDAARAFALFKSAAERGLPEGQYNLGVCFLNGEGVARDEKQAATWCAAAARQGVLPAQVLLMRCYLGGTGLEKSPVKALAWDFLARRTLALRKGGDMGAPPPPGPQRADGAVPQTDAAGRTVWLHAGGGRETTDGSGTRLILYPGGVRVTITPNGTRETRTAAGDLEWRLADGTQILATPAGATRTQYPDGRLESKDGVGGTQIVYPNGARSNEGPGTMATGELVQVLESYNAAGQLRLKRIYEKERTVEVLPDKSWKAEYPGVDAAGHPLKMIESYDSQGELIGRDLVKPNGTRHEGAEEWIIVRWFRDQDKKQRVQVRETYGAGNSIMKTDELEREAIPPVAPAPPAARPAKIIFTIPQIPADNLNTTSSLSARNGDAETKATLGALQDLELASRNFAGATEADYKAAQAQATRYLVPLDNPPQSPEASWSKAKAERLSTTPRLNESTSDFSKAHPFGQNGQEAIKALPWKHAESDHFIVHFTELKTAEPVLEYIEAAYAVVVQLLQVEENKGAAKSHVFVFPDQARWKAWLAKHSLSNDVAGYAYKSELLVGAGQEQDDYLKTICHEATHATVARYYVGRHLPLWLSEGLAEYTASKALALQRGQATEKYLATGASAPDLRAVLGRQGYFQNGAANLEQLRAFYRTSERCVLALNERLDSPNFPKLVNLLAAGNPVDLSLRATYGATCDSAEALAKLLASPK